LIRCIKKYLADKICILVTHQIQFLQDATQILVLDNGQLVQKGTYKQLISSSSSFAHLLEDIHQHEQEMTLNYQNQQSIISSIVSENEIDDETIQNTDTKQEGNVKWHVYLSYIKSGFGGFFGFCFILLILAVYQALTIYSSWWLAHWSDEEGYRYGTFNINCTTTTTKNGKEIEKFRLMNETQWNQNRNQRFYVFSGMKSNLIIYR